MADKPPLTEFDMVTIPPSFQIMKAMLPFLDINLQKNLSLIIRFMELKQTLDFFNYANNITSMSNKNTNTDSDNSNFLLNLLNNDAFMNSIAPYLPENYQSMISGFKMFSSMSDLFNQSNMDISDILGKYMGSGTSANDNNKDNININPQKPSTQDNENDGETNSNNNASNQTRQPSEADKGFSIFSNAMNQDQQKLFDEYLKELDNLDLSKDENE